MKCSSFCGVTVIPTLSRLVLALAFITVGVNKITTTSPFSAADAGILASYGIEVEPNVTTAGDGRWIIKGASAQTTLSPEAVNEAIEKLTEDVSEALGDADGSLPEVLNGGDQGGFVRSTPTTTPPAVPGKARSLYGITVMMHKAGLPQPKYGAWMAAVVELVGGSLLLVGFLSRVWGLGLAFTMGVAFYIVTMGQNGVFEMSPFEFAKKDIGNFNTMFSQLGLGLLAFGIFLTGPGPLSLDHLFFRRKKRPSAEDALAELGAPPPPAPRQPMMTPTAPAAPAPAAPTPPAAPAATPETPATPPEAQKPVPLVDEGDNPVSQRPL